MALHSPGIMLYRAEPGDGLRDQIDFDQIKALDKQISRYGSYFYCVNTDTGVKIGYSAAGWNKQTVNPHRIIFYRRMYPYMLATTRIIAFKGVKSAAAFEKLVKDKAKLAGFKKQMKWEVRGAEHIGRTRIDRTNEVYYGALGYESEPLGALKNYYKFVDGTGTGVLTEVQQLIDETFYEWNLTRELRDMRAGVPDQVYGADGLSINRYEDSTRSAAKAPEASSMREAPTSPAHAKPVPAAKQPTRPKKPRQKQEAVQTRYSKRIAARNRAARNQIFTRSFSHVKNPGY